MADTKNKSATDDSTDQDDGQLGEAGQKALARERQARREAENRIKELEPLAAKATQLENDKKTAEQRLADEIKGLKDDLAKERHRAMVAEVAREKGLNAAQSKRLVGATREELEEDADDLLASFSPKANGKTDGKAKDEDDDADEPKEKGGKDRGEPGRRPKERLRAGAVSDTDEDDDEFDPEKVADAVRGRSF